MSTASRLRAPAALAWPLAAVLVAGLGCSGSRGSQGGALSRGASFTLSAAPSSLSVPAGGSGYVTVGATRYGGFTGEIALSVPALPPGVTAGGTLAAGATTGRLVVVVDASVGAVDLGSLTIQGTSGGLKGSTPLHLALLAPLPPSSLPPDRVQASGTLQAAGEVENRILAGEPVEASLAQDGTPTQVLRHGFLPVANPAQP